MRHNETQRNATEHRKTFFEHTPTLLNTMDTKKLSDTLPDTMTHDRTRRGTMEHRKTTSHLKKHVDTLQCTMRHNRAS